MTRVVVLLVVVVLLLLVVTYRLSSKFPKLVQIIFKPLPNQHGVSLVPGPSHRHGYIPYRDFFGFEIDEKSLKMAFSWSKRPFDRKIIET